MTPQPPKIAIIGAGPTGCMLARLLLHLSSEADIPPPTVHIFESEPSPNYRSQGGTLDLHPKTGLAALQAAGLFDKFLDHARYDGDALQVTDKNLQVIGVGGATNKIAKRVSGARPEIDRADLRRIITSSLPTGTIRWSKRLKQILNNSSSSPPTAGKSLEFTNDQVVGPYNLVIGADGAWSKTRISSPIFCKIALLDLSIPPPAKDSAPEVYDLINKGNLFAYSTGGFVSVQTMGDGSINVYAQWAIPSSFQTASSSHEEEDRYWESCPWYFPHDPDKTREALVAKGGPFADWHPLLKEAILKATDRCTPTMLYQLPVGFKWDHQEGVTLIGDAAHLMTPYAGEGVNVGLMDALVLGRNIVAALRQEQEREQDNTTEDEEEEKIVTRGLLDKAVTDYENEMWPRAEKIARLTDDLKQLWMFTEGSPGSVIATTTSLHAMKDAHWVWHPLIWACVHVYFWGRRLI
ncbi:putative tetracycline resistance protein from transposon protein, partial [Rhypophila decipiens]